MPLLDLFFTILWIYLLFAWIWLVVTVLVDIFRSPDLSGWGRAGWALLVALAPLIGVLIYMIARGSSMQQRKYDDVAAQQRAANDYIRSVANTGVSVSDELIKLGQLRDNGVITSDQFEQQKAKLLT